MTVLLLLQASTLEVGGVDRRLDRGRRHVPGGPLCGDGSVARFKRTTSSPEALRRYRTRYDDDAWRLFNEALEQDDPGAFEDLIGRYFFSSKTDEATMRLSSWLMDSGRAKDAAVHLHRLLLEYPDPDIPRSLIAARLVHALELAGEGDRLFKTGWTWGTTSEQQTHVLSGNLSGWVTLSSRNLDPRPL